MFLILCIAVTAFSWAFAHVYYQRTQFEDASLWLHDTEDTFGDFSCYSDLFTSFHTNDFFFGPDDRFAYPAPAAVVYFWLYSMGPHQLYIFLGGIITAALAAAGLFLRSLIRRGIAAWQATLFVAGVTLSSWPLLFLFERANLEFIVWLVAALGLWALLRNHPFLAAILFGLTGSFKIYPLVLLALLFQPRYRWPFLTGMAAFGLSLLTAFWFVGPSIPTAFHGTINGILGFVSNYAATAHSELRFDHSFLATIKQFASNPPWNYQDFTTLSHIYVPVVAAGATLLFLLRVNKLPLINRILFMAICMVALPPVSYDYTLVHLYIPFALIVLAAVHASQSGANMPGFKRALACFGVLFTPQLFLFHNDFALNGVLKSLAMIGLLVLLARYPWTDSAWHNADATAGAESA
ncbi:MAG TPA: glycosyltransferase family 87 protein [Acidobacteriaceae bacterium]|nr:glycosyltransferase family 87 protein [Acidobacteriaceae bacterium]